MNTYTCHTGGAEGSDIMWERIGLESGISVISYSFKGHNQLSKYAKILTSNELSEGFEHVLIANKSLKRNIFKIDPYIKNLLSRNWYQVRNSDAIFAIGIFKDNKHNSVSGGTGWAIQMAIDNKKDVYFFNQGENYIKDAGEFFDMKDFNNQWYIYEYNEMKFLKMNNIPKLTNNFAGIGTRNINIRGINAIENIYKNTLTSENKYVRK